MYEIRTALSYLIPRRGQLSISVVGLIAVLVIQAITWLILVFFSTTEGFEYRWSQKIIGAVGPLRVAPTSSYFESPYYQIDLYSGANSFAPQRLSKKIASPFPTYDPETDPPLPHQLESWYASHRSSPNPIAAATHYLDQSSIPWRAFESTVCHVSIPTVDASSSHTLNQYTCVLGLDQLNPEAFAAINQITSPEVESLLSHLRTPTPAILSALEPLASSIGSIEVALSQSVDDLPAGTRLSGAITFNNTNAELQLSRPDGKPLSIPLSQSPLPFSVITAKLAHPPLALPPQETFSYVASLGYPALLPKQMRQQGARLLDTGSFQFSGASMSGEESLSIPFYIAGFFDPGILPIGGKLVLTSRQAVMAIQPDLDTIGPFASSGIIVDAPLVALDATQASLQHELDTVAPGLFSAQRFDQYEVTSELYQQLASEKTLFRLLSLIIVAVACSNIFSMLFILAHDRRKEIAVLRALGASRPSIMAIFVFAGLGVGLLGSICGSVLAAITLHYLPQILALIGSLQGHAVLHAGVYGDIAPQTISHVTLLFAFGSICLTSAVAGACAAVRACRMNVSEALRS
jgi:lipoprotein-releasing system permease protein